MIQINLIPDVKRQFLRARRMRDIAISISILVSVVAIGVVVAMGLFLSSQVAREYFVDQTIKTEYATLSSQSGLNDLVTIQNQLSKISGQHENQSMDSRLFSVLQAINPAAPNDVSFSSVDLDPTTGTLTLQGTANAGYGAVEVLAKTMQNTNIQYDDSSSSSGTSTIPFASNIEIVQTSYGVTSDNQQVLTFKLQVTYAQDLFTNQLQGVKVIAPTKQIDVTDSKLRVPSDLFTAVIDNTKGNQ